MLRIKDPRVSVPFYETHFGMKLVHWICFPEWKFTVYFMERQMDGQTSPDCTMDCASVESEKYLFTMTGATLELTHNHGSEDDPSFKVWSGNTGRDAGEPGSANYADEPAARLASLPPCTVIFGDRDWVKTPSAEDAARALPGGRLHVVKGGFHHLYFDMPEKFHAMVAEALA